MPRLVLSRGVVPCKQGCGLARVGLVGGKCAGGRPSVPDKGPTTVGGCFPPTATIATSNGWPTKGQGRHQDPRAGTGSKPRAGSGQLARARAHRAQASRRAPGAPDSVGGCAGQGPRGLGVLWPSRSAASGGLIDGRRAGEGRGLADGSELGGSWSDWQRCRAEVTA